MKTITKNNGLKYDTQDWDHSKISCYTNCYAYAMDLKKNPLSGEYFENWSHVQPGNLGGRNKEPWWLHKMQDAKTDIEQDKLINELTDAVRDDLAQIGMEMILSTFEETLDENCWKVAFYVSFNRPDYHWYRLNDDGTWSHKQGRCSITNKDENHNVITNPETCDRGGYERLIGFFIIKRI